MMRCTSKKIIFSVALLSLWLNSCKFFQTKKESTSAKSPQESQNGDPSQVGNPTIDNGKFKVLVIDDGFDTTLPVFQNKLIASYDLKCTQTTPSTPPSFNSYETYKQYYISKIKNPSTTQCSIQKNIVLEKSQNFGQISRFKNAWNRYFIPNLTAPNDPWKVSILNNNPSATQSQISSSEFTNIQKVLGGEETYNYHGTQVASLIAYNNPNVELVFFDITLLSGNEKQVYQTCPTQKEVDWSTRLYQESEYIEAAKNKPLDAVDNEFNSIIKTYNFDFVNTSFGELPVSIREKEIRDANCGNIRLGPNREAETKFDQIVEKHMDTRRGFPIKAVGILALGNSGVSLNTLQDGEECGVVQTITVGSTNHSNQISEFSNRGSCADVYALGENVVAAYPDNFLNATSGTSFSAPLFLRHLTLTHPKSSDYSTLIQSHKRTNQIIPADTFPKELMFDRFKESKGISLTKEKGTAVTPRPIKKILKKFYR